MSRLSENVFEEEVEAKYKCAICLFVLKDPVQTPCGHLFCRPCITAAIRKFAAVCPLDNTSLTESKLRADEAVKREMSRFKVKCPNEGYGCCWKGTLGQFEGAISSRTPSEVVPSFRPHQRTDSGFPSMRKIKKNISESNTRSSVLSSRLEWTAEHEPRLSSIRSESPSFNVAADTHMTWTKPTGPPVQSMTHTPK